MYRTHSYVLIAPLPLVIPNKYTIKRLSHDKQHTMLAGNEAAIELEVQLKSQSQRWPFSQPAQGCPLARSLHDVVLEERLESIADLEVDEGLQSTEVVLSLMV